MIKQCNNINEFYEVYLRDMHTSFEFDNEPYFIDMDYCIELIYSKKWIDEKLYFLKIDENRYYDFVNHLMFREKENNIVNNRSATFFNKRDLRKVKNTNEILKNINDFDYMFDVQDYFDALSRLRHKDNMLIAKARKLLLTKGVKFMK